MHGLPLLRVPGEFAAVGVVNRIDRILTAYEGSLTADKVVELGITADDLDAAVSLARLDLELTQSMCRLTAREIIEAFIERLGE